MWNSVELFAAYILFLYKPKYAFRVGVYEYLSPGYASIYCNFMQLLWLRCGIWGVG